MEFMDKSRFPEPGVYDAAEFWSWFNGPPVTGTITVTRNDMGDAEATVSPDDLPTVWT